MDQIADVSRRGGVERTTSAVQLAVGRASLGRGVLLAYVDPQGTVAKTLGVSRPCVLRHVVFGVEAADAVAERVRTNLDVLVLAPAARTNYLGTRAAQRAAEDYLALADSFSGALTVVTNHGTPNGEVQKSQALV